MDIIQKLTEEIQVKRGQVEAAVKLIDEGNTIPFISRYRKEATGSLNDEQLRTLHERLLYLRNLEDKKKQVLSSIEDQGKLTKELKEQMQITRQLTKAGMEFCEGILEGQDVVVVRSGVGKVNAAVCTQILIDDFDAEVVINTGIAGSLNADINIGDIVVSTDLIHHDMNAVNFGYEPGQIPQMDVFSFEADKALADLAEKVCEEVNPEIQVFHGRVVSGDQFIADKETKENISTLFAGYCTEMEGAAIAQTAHLNEVPFVVLRAISDKADDSASMDYPTFEKQAVAHSVRLVRGMMKNLAAKEA